MSRTLYVGIDGGATRARALVVDEDGVELARIIGPAGIVRAEDPAAATAIMQDLTASVLDAAGGRDADVVLCCALAGAGRDIEREALRVGLTVANVASAVLIVGDAEAMMTDAFGDEPGVLLIAGTGSIAWARAGDGAQVRVGGWGLLLGDEGSGYDVGLAALRAVARAADGRERETVLTDLILTTLQLSAPGALIAWGARASKSEIGRLAPLVLQAAEAGDGVALDIRARTVDELVLHATTAAHAAALSQPHVALAGGLIEAGSSLRRHVVAALLERMPGCSVSDESLDGARGATLLARRAARSADSRGTTA